MNYFQSNMPPEDVYGTLEQAKARIAHLEGQLESVTYVKNI